MTPVEQVLADIRAIAINERDKGDRFERLMLHAFKTDRTFRRQFSEIWMWMEWPERGSADIGVDLVARDSEGNLIAIQCKCYGPNTVLTKEDIDSFVAFSGQKHWTRRIIVATTDMWSANAEKSLEGHTVPIERMGIDDLDAMTVDWGSYDVDNPAGLRPTARHVLRPHQVKAVNDVRAGFEHANRGKLIMACGTGKTFTALRIAEEHAGAGKSVLFLAPSIALVAQSLKEWTAECDIPIRPFAVCSDATAGRTIDGENATPHDLVVPPTTDASALIQAGVHNRPASEMTVVFSTYQSIEVVADMQAITGQTFDLVVCDEAHRTAGLANVGGEDRVFALVHDDTVIPSVKRLYMTATPRLFKPAAADAAKDADAIVASMDDPLFFGEEFHRLGFGEAVEKGLLADYRVLILTVDETAVSQSFQDLLSSNGELSLPDVARFVGCLSGLAKLPGAAGSGFTGDEPAMQRAVAFWSKIADSERFAQQFEQVAEAYFDQLQAGPAGDEITPLGVPTRHVDGTSTIISRRTDIRWLKENPPAAECRVLTNARCLTEGVDVPALDAVMFLTPRRSRIDIVQAVGRVMRKPPGKQLGYVILPVAITTGLDPAAALDKNTDYDAVWEVLQALRAHDERFNAYINRIALSSTKPGARPDDPIKVIPVDVVGPDGGPAIQERLFEYEAWTGAIYTKIVQKVGTRAYWENWARDVSQMAARHEARIIGILSRQQEVADVFDEFLTELQTTLNESINRDDAISMVSQHLITRPIFEALFGNDEFGMVNPVSVAMSRIVDILDQHRLQTETKDLEAFFASIRRSVEGIHLDDGEARQRIIKDLYGRFFKLAFPKVADSLGIVYTPIEVVDFIVRATQAALAEHFDGASLSDEGVHILDPFTGTGTFLTRLLQSGFIAPHDLDRKFAHELHANEIMLLAYYIAAVNIEATYRQERVRHSGIDPGYRSFPGIVLTDTFHLGETGDGSATLDIFPLNNERATRQKSLDIRVIFGNPPYSTGQDSANDNNANLKYSQLDASIASTYVKRSTGVNKNSLYDSYVRAIRWASDRLLCSPRRGLVALVTNGGYIDSKTFDGLRATLSNEFHHLYIFNLRGNQRVSDWRKEGGKIFDAGSQATVAIMLLIRQASEVPASGAVLHYREIGDYLSRDEKLNVLADALPMRGDDPPLLSDMNWAIIQPDAHGDWINQRSASFATHTPIQSTEEPSLFEVRSNGLQTNRDAWNYNSSEAELSTNLSRMIDNYNVQVDRFAAAYPGLKGTLKYRAEIAKGFVDLDSTKFSWDRANFADVARGRHYSVADAIKMVAIYRPFHPRFATGGRLLNKEASQLHRVFPQENSKNAAICLPPPGSMAPPFGALMSKKLVDNGLFASSATVLFPQYIYDTGRTGDTATLDLFGDDSTADVTGRRHNITAYALALYQELDASIQRDDIFFYVYAVLHSPAYRNQFASDLRKSLPRIPRVTSGTDFWSFSRSGRELAYLHTEYESLEAWKDLSYSYAPDFDPKHPDAYRVLKMKHPKVKDAAGVRVDDRTRIVYNDWITIESIPGKIYDYKLATRSAIEWVMESFRVRTDRASKIINDPNSWAIESGDTTYIFNLVGRIVTMSLRTLDVVESLPNLDL